MPSVMKSSGPDTATTVLRRCAKAIAPGAAASVESVESTPLPPAPSPAKARISEALPRIANGVCGASFCAKAVRMGNAPIATGSNTHGVADSLAAATASSIAKRCSGVGVPKFTSTPPATRAKGPASPTMSVIAGAAPIASTTLAVKLVTTELVMHCTKGLCARSSPSNAAAKDKVMAFRFLPLTKKNVQHHRSAQ